MSEYGEYYGYPIQSQDDSEPDCRRTSWSIKVDNEWHEIVTCALEWRDGDASNALIKILKRKVDRLDGLLMAARVESQELAGDEPYNIRIRVIVKILQQALNIDTGKKEQNSLDQHLES